MPWIERQPSITDLCGDPSTPGGTRPSASLPNRYVTATCRRSRRAERGRRCGLTIVKHRDMGSRQTAPAPPNRHNRYLRKTLNRPLCFYARPSRPSCAFRGPHTAMCHGAPGHERVFQRFVFFQLGGPTRPAPRYVDGGLSCRLTATDMLSSVCLALTPSRLHRGVDRQKVADIAAWGRTADPCRGAD